MIRTNQNFAIFKGESFIQGFLHVGPFWRSHDQVIPIDEADEIKFSLSGREDHNDIKFVRTRTNGDITVTDSEHYEESDVIKVTIAPENTENLLVGNYQYQLQVVYSGQDYRVVASGVVKLKNRVDYENATIKYLAGMGGSVTPEEETIHLLDGTASGSTATADGGYVFVNWTNKQGEIVSTNTTFVPDKINGINMPTKYIANFEESV